MEVSQPERGQKLRLRDFVHAEVELTEEIAGFLLTPEGRILIAEAEKLLSARTDTLTALTRLRKSASPEHALAAWEMADLQRRGMAKFGADAAQMFFEREALEQASGKGAAAYHAQRLAAAGIAEVADLGGGIGGDTLAFARSGLSVTLYESDPVRARFAEENVRAAGLAHCVHVVSEDVTKAFIDTDALWLDPARRQDSRRVFDPEDYSPPLSWLHTLSAKAIGVKLSPAIDHAIAKLYGAELEFLSEGGECREALLWKGAAQTGEKLRATVLTSGGPQSLIGDADNPGNAELRQSGNYLYEPDPAIIRAHLVSTLAEQLGAGIMDPHIAYLLGDCLIETPFATAYTILEQFPYSLKRLQAALSARNAGRVIIKKRGFPLEPEELRKRLKLKGTEEVIVILARVGSGHVAFITAPATPLEVAGKKSQLISYNSGDGDGGYDAGGPSA